MTDRAASFLNLIRRDRRGRLKLYLGYAAGVGKTYQMLLEAHRLKEEGVDVAVGVVETHGRTETVRLAEGLERIPMLRREYRGVALEEMDLEAALARKPEVILVDELAHTNIPGSRNAKRYQDVQDILAAGIHVISALNVQHLESLYDLVEKATGVKVRERVPDSVLLEADQIINVDLAPEDLQKRLKAGKIYPLERVDTALEHFFRSAHLGQLRELALRELAAQLDSRRREAAEEGNRGALDQVMVCLDSDGPHNAALLRYGSRLAGRLNRNWYAVYVQALAEGALRIDAAKQRNLSDTLTLANRLGATVFTFKGEDVAETLLRFAREYRVGYVILGRPAPKPRLRSWLPWRKSVAEKMLALGRGLNLIVIDAGTGEGRSAAEEPPAPAAAQGLADHLAPERIRIWKDPVAKERAMRDLLQAILDAEPGLDRRYLWEKLQARESSGSTFLNEGIALPHARVEGLERPLVALGLSQGGILDAYTPVPIEIVFLLLTPADAHRDHLQLLASAGRAFQDRALRKALARASASGEVMRILKGK